jgi:tRNA(fMet)-specific endonuclease VapC
MGDLALVTYLLDTNVCIQYLNGHDLIQSRLLSLSTSQVSTCEIVCFELYYGAFKSRQVADNVALIGKPARGGCGWDPRGQ